MPTKIQRREIQLQDLVSSNLATDASGNIVAGPDFTASIALKANTNSPTFTGTPTLPTGTIGVTQTAGNNTTALATTAFVTGALALKGVMSTGVITATASQTVFTVPSYTLSSTKIDIYINGIMQNITTDYTETSTTSITFTFGLTAGDIVKYIITT